MEVYSHNQLGYNITFSTASSSRAVVEQGSLCLVMMEWLNRWGIKSTRFHRPNLVSNEIVTGHTWNLLVSTYLPPSIMDHPP